VSIANDGTVWGVNAAQQIFRCSASACSWEWVPGQLTEVAAGSGGIAWGVNSSDNILSYSPTLMTGSWIIASLNSGKCLTVSGASGADGAGIVQWDCLYKHPEQNWSLAQNGSSFEIVDQNSGKCLDVSGAGTGDGVPIQQYTCLANHNNQLWYLQTLSDNIGGLYQIKSVNSNKCLDVAGISKSNGAVVQQYSCQGSEQANQVWTNPWVFNSDATTVIGDNQVVGMSTSTALVMQDDGNLVMYKYGSPVWSSGTQQPCNGNCFAAFQSDGNFVLYGPNGAYWSTGTNGAKRQLQLLTTPPYIQVVGGNSVLWAGSTACQLSIPDCPNHPGFVNTFYDNVANAGSNQSECLQRATDYRNWCGTQASVNATYFGRNGAQLATYTTTSNPRFSCQISITQCPNHTNYNHTTLNDSAGSASSAACKQRIKDYISWCGSNAHSYVGAFTRNGKVLMSRYNK
jgi:hypothetical protein